VKPSLLYVSPVVPALSGNGLAMRAGYVLLAHTRRYQVSLVVVARYASPAGLTVPEEIACHCQDVVVLPSEASLAAGRLQQRHFDAVHAFRLESVPFARALAGGQEPSPEWRLDLDDVESSTHRRIAALYRLNGDEVRAREAETAATVAEAREVEALAEFDRVYVCSDGDVDRLPICSRAEVHVLPNALPVPEPLPPPQTGPAVMLFVGTLGYYPNAEGVRWFATDVLPVIRERTARAVELHVVGTGFSPLLGDLAGIPGVRLIGHTPDLRPWYERARLVVVPVRAGGGTRIKVLEAFSLRRPVVSTTVGVEGIAVEEEHVLLADTPEAFGSQCLRLMDDPALAERLAARAFALFSARSTTEELARIVAAVPAPRPRREFRPGGRSPVAR
jgi:glycosyltransferase involved in cell wall biosynthesis